MFILQAFGILKPLYIYIYVFIQVNSPLSSFQRHEMQQAQMLADIVLAPQTRIYVGPIEDHTTGDDLQLQFAQYGPIVGVSRLGGRQVR